jgi:hypothetical protein
VVRPDGYGHWRDPTGPRNRLPPDPRPPRHHRGDRHRPTRSPPSRASVAGCRPGWSTADPGQPRRSTLATRHDCQLLAVTTDHPSLQADTPARRQSQRPGWRAQDSLGRVRPA